MRSGNSRFLMSAGTLLSAALQAASAQAAAINVDINGLDENFNGGSTYAHVAAAPDPGTVWNGYGISTYYDTGDPNPLTNLKDSLGNTTGVSFDLSSKTGYSDNAGPDDLQRDFVYAHGFGSPVTVAFTLSGLATDGTTYDLYLYDGVRNHPARFTIGGISQDVVPGSSWGAANVFIAGTNYTLFSNVLPVSGTITGTLSGVPSNGEADFNGLQLIPTAGTPVPEPASLGLLIVGGAAALLRRRCNR